MPEYRATRFINTREADTCHFTAASDEEARERLLSGNIPEWSGDADLIDCDLPDEVLALDRKQEDGSYEAAGEEIELPGMMPYGQPSRDFTSKIAALAGTDAYNDPLQTLIWLIEEANQLCGRSPARQPASPS